MKKMIWILLLLVVTISSFIILWKNLQWRARITTHEMLAREFFRNVATVIESLYNETGELPPPNMNDCLQWIHKHNLYYENLEKMAEGTGFVVDLQASKIKDKWGGEVKLLVNESGQYTLISYWKDRVPNQDVKGDDIIYSFTIRENGSPGGRGKWENEMVSGIFSDF